MSLPNSSGIMPAAKAAAAPPEEPPDVISGFQGLRVVLKSGLSHWKSIAIEDKLDLPTIATPARLNRATLGASEFGRKFASGGKPDVAGNPSTAMLSFTVIVLPSSGPRSAFAAPLIAFPCRLPGGIHVHRDDGVDGGVDCFDSLDGRHQQFLSA